MGRKSTAGTESGGAVGLAGVVGGDSANLAGLRGNWIEMNSITLDPRRNRLLAALPEAEYERWLPHLEPVEMPLGEVLFESGSRLNRVYFPVTAIVSLLYVLESGASAEIAVVGYEGIVGVSLFMGGGSTPSRAVVQSAGQGFRLRASSLMKEFNRSGPVLHLLLRYTQALITQMTQTAVCNRHHARTSSCAAGCC